MKSKNTMYLMVPSITCTCCETTIFSRARHDFRSCECGDLSIDGGFTEYTPRILFKNCVPKVKKIRVYATKQELYNDWNKKIDKFGLIKQ